MNKENKTPLIRFKGFSDDWEQRKFYEIFNFMQNNALSRAELSNDYGEVMNVHYGDILVKYGEILDVKKDEVTYLLNSELLKKYQTSVLQNGDIIIADAAEDETVGKCSEITGLSNEIVLSGLHTIPCRPKEKYAKGYLGFYMNSNAYHDQLLPLLQGTKVSSISKSAIQDTNIVYPKSETEQAKIGSYFQSLDNLITLHQCKCESLKKVKKSMLQKMFPKNGESVPEIRFAGFTDDWEQRKLGEVGTTYTGLSGKSKEDFGHGEGKFITYMNVFSNAISDSEMVEPIEIDTKQNEVKKGDVFFTTSSETPEEVGMSSVLLEDCENTYLNSFCFGYRPIEKFDNRYLAFMLRSSEMRKKITFLAQGISRYNISKNRMMEIEIPIPSLSEQQKIGSYFQSLDNLITLHQRKVEKLKNIKKSMLQKMFV